MLDETTRRRADLEPGTPIRLADGQTWMFPAPPPPDEGDPRDTALVRTVLEAEDQDDRRRCELALIISLLSRNYDLDPVDYQALLSFPPGSAEAAQAQAAFAALARDYASRLMARDRAEPRTAAAGPTGWMRGLRRVGARLRPVGNPVNRHESAVAR